MSIVPQVGMVELLVLGIMALLIVGPKDFPRMTRAVGEAMAKVRRMADEFRASFDQMAREAEIEEMRKEIEALRAADPTAEMKAAAQEIEKTVRAPLSSSTDEDGAATAGETAEGADVR